MNHIPPTPAANQEAANRIITFFDSALQDLVAEHLFDKVTPDQVNVYYGFANDCLITKTLRDVIEAGTTPLPRPNEEGGQQP